MCDADFPKGSLTLKDEIEQRRFLRYSVLCPQLWIIEQTPIWKEIFHSSGNQTRALFESDSNWSKATSDHNPDQDPIYEYYW